MSLPTVTHLLTGAELAQNDIASILYQASAFKKNRHLAAHALQGKHVALLFDKLSLRTRLSFAIAINELGGQFVESISGTRKTEDPADQMRVIQGYCHALMIRTHKDADVKLMAAYATIPIINGLTDTYHPCQTLADLLTLQEKFGDLAGLKICYVGDGNNVLHSLLLMAPKMGMQVNYCCLPEFGPLPEVLAQVAPYIQQGLIQAFTDVQLAVQNCHAIYTDVWTSMGFADRDEQQFSHLQVNEALMQQAHPDAVVMHCMPMNRGKEVSAALPDKPCSVIFQQSENRLHVQKALLVKLLGGG